MLNTLPCLTDWYINSTTFSTNFTLYICSDNHVKHNYQLRSKQSLTVCNSKCKISSFLEEIMASMVFIHYFVNELKHTVDCLINFFLLTPVIV